MITCSYLNGFCVSLYVPSEYIFCNCDDCESTIHAPYFAGFTDETPRDYQCNLGPDGRRRDADERPELCRGTVEFIATREYMVSNLLGLQVMY